ncbi:unnamed protein product [Rhizoctonia solani]|uniref:Uncharacterized protein n=1 Tax=Rhizoctonia solani TaxID=456999 RepID=A0A8H3HKS9_9AGAM|nr:unnamed protein product [Rhizoctonia solani]
MARTSQTGQCPLEISVGWLEREQEPVASWNSDQPTNQPSSPGKQAQVCKINCSQVCKNEWDGQEWMNGNMCMGCIYTTKPNSQACMNKHANTLAHTTDHAQARGFQQWYEQTCTHTHLAKHIPLHGQPKYGACIHQPCMNN